MEALAEHQALQDEIHQAGTFSAELDSVILKLPNADQNILLLRFYEGLSFREISQRIGKSEDASQKQASRALEKLRQLIGRRGVAIDAKIYAGLCFARSRV